MLWSTGARPAVAQEADGACAAVFSEAENQYLNGHFDRAVALLRACLDQEQPSGDEAVRIYRLLALAYLYDGQDDDAEQAVRSLLDHVSDYTSDPVQDPPSYASLVNSVREERLVRTNEPPADARVAPSEQEKAEPSTNEETVAVQQGANETSGEAEEAASPPQEESPPPILPPDGSLSGGDDTRARLPLNGPKQWLMATGGAAVIFTAVALALGG